MRAERSDDPQDFIRRDWTALVHEDPTGTFFQTPAYLKLYWEEFGDELDLSFLFARDDDAAAPRGAVALERIGTTIRFLGGTEVTDYMGPVAAVGDREAVAHGFVELLTSDESWSTAELLGLRDGSPWIDALQEAAGSQGIPASLADYDVAPGLPLPASWDAYLEALPSKLRHEVKRKARKLTNDAGEWSLVFSDPDRVDHDLERFFELHRSSQGEKGKFMQPGMEIFFRRLAAAFLPTGEFRLGFIQIGEQWVAGAVGFVFNGTFSLYNSAFDRDWIKLSPGMVLVGELIRAAIEEGCSTFDMLKGDLEYKYRFGAEPRKLLRLDLSR